MERTPEGAGPAGWERMSRNLTRAAAPGEPGPIRGWMDRGFLDGPP